MQLPRHLFCFDFLENMAREVSLLGNFTEKCRNTAQPLSRDSLGWDGANALERWKSGLKGKAALWPGRSGITRAVNLDNPPPLAIIIADMGEPAGFDTEGAVVV